MCTLLARMECNKRTRLKIGYNYIISGVSITVVTNKHKGGITYVENCSLSSCMDHKQLPVLIFLAIENLISRNIS